MKLPFDPIDYTALAWFFVIWIGYQRFAAWRADKKHPSLMSVMSEYRREWWQEIIHRELRIVDVTILTNLANSSTFFASTTLLIIGGFLALLGTSEQAAAILSDLPFSQPSQETIWEYKVLLLVGIFVYAFFKFTWSLRQNNFVAMLIGAAPGEEADPERVSDFVVRAARVASLSADNFNYGLRAYYFGLAALSWFLNSWIFIFVTAWVALILYVREFHSQVLRTLRRD